ncbi:MAG: helix-turn-helix domain-containing protein [Mangrovibacterium sp.]
MRFYDRQFITREKTNKGVLTRFSDILNAYLDSNEPKENGLPSVAYFADKLNLSPNYFGDLVKRETGKSAKEQIQLQLIRKAKDLIYDNQRSISEISYELGFHYPQHFSRLFKNETGMTPNEFRNLN